MRSISGSRLQTVAAIARRAMESTIISTNVSANLNNGNVQNKFDDVVTRFAISFNIYFTPTLIILGVLGNIACVYVFFVTKMKCLSTSRYLSVLAISDTLFLLQLVPPWLSTVQITNIFHREIFCEFFVYNTYVACSVSAWLVVAFTLERFVAVIYPLRRNSVCTVARARYVISGIVVLSVLLNIPVMKYTMVVNGKKCHIDKKYLLHAQRFNTMDTIVTFTIPLTAIVVLNAWITRGVLRLGQDPEKLMKSEGPRNASSTHFMGNQRAQHKVTLMLLIVSSVYVLLNLPTYVIRLVAYAYDLNNKETDGRWMALQLFTDMFFHTNFGINFFLYCLTGQNFRRALIQSVPCLRRRRSFVETMKADFALQPRIGSFTMSHSSRTEAVNLHVSAGASARRSMTQGPYNSGQNRRRWSRPSSHIIDRSSRHPEIEETSFSAQPPRACDIQPGTSSTIDVELHAAPTCKKTKCEYSNRQGHFIKRWKFDNSRQIRKPVDDTENIDEMSIGGKQHPQQLRRISQPQLCTVTKF